MARSAAFARIKSEVLTLMRTIPPGRITTYDAVGRRLDVMARHVGYILATLDPAEEMSVPWHRAISARGEVSFTNPARGARQVELLREEGIGVAGKGRIIDVDELQADLDAIRL